MGKKADTWGELEKQLDAKIQIALRSLGEDVVNVMREKVEEHVYMDNPKVYDRTGNFADSVMATKLKPFGKGHRLNVEHNIKFLRLYNDPDNFIYGSHYNRKYNYNDDISEWLPEILAYNKSGNFFGANQAWHNRENYFEETWNIVEKDNWIEDRMRKYLGV